MQMFIVGEDFLRNVTPRANRTAATFSLYCATFNAASPLQEVQFQRLVQGHEVAVSGDPPERHIVLHRDRPNQIFVKIYI